MLERLQGRRANLPGRESREMEEWEEERWQKRATRIKGRNRQMGGAYRGSACQENPAGTQTSLN